MKPKINVLLFLLVITFNIVSNETNSEYAEPFKDVLLAAQLGSGQDVIIDLNATEGLKGKIAQNVRDGIQEEKKTLTFFEWVKYFFSIFKSSNH
jgi:hypothetical protein